MDDVLKVVHALKDNPRVKLLVLAGDLFEPFEPLVKDLGLCDRVVVRHNVVDIENYIAASDAGIYASERESFGMGVLETMSFGKPVVATEGRGRGRRSWSTARPVFCAAWGMSHNWRRRCAS